MLVTSVAMCCMTFMCSVIHVLVRDLSLLNASMLRMPMVSMLFMSFY